MKHTLKKLNIFFGMLALFASIFIFAAFFTGLPKNTFINGVNVSRLNRSAAIKAVRESIVEKLKGERLQIYAGDNIYTYSYPEINFKDNLKNVVNGVKKSGEYHGEIKYYLNGINDVVSSILAGVTAEKVEPYAIFNRSGEPFTYVDGKEGKTVNAQKLITDINNSLNGGFSNVKVQILSKPFRGNLNEIKKNTVLLSQFSTKYDQSNKSRSHNINLACEKINGTILRPQSLFSFNGTVGERTVKNGYLQAKIIEGGRFIDGLGGGVCQVSTTLYNAALLSGLAVTEFHPHSLKVGYVAPSRDAMVSGNYFDLKFKNCKNQPVFIRASAHNGTLTVKIYGKSDGATYKLSSKIIAEIAPPPPEEKGGNGGDFIVEEKCGIESEGYLTVTKNGVSKTTLIRKDKYAAVRGVRGVAPNFNKFAL
ncbi:MAG: VanW family protein [Clostridia bacterium]|nr:VanW family protein [Clostridia bacterium]